MSDSLEAYPCAECGSHVVPGDDELCPRCGQLVVKELEVSKQQQITLEGLREAMETVRIYERSSSDPPKQPPYRAFWLDEVTVCPEGELIWEKLRATLKRLDTQAGVIMSGPFTTEKEARRH